MVFLFQAVFSISNLLGLILIIQIFCLAYNFCAHFRVAVLTRSFIAISLLMCTRQTADTTKVLNLDTRLVMCTWARSFV